MSLNSLESKTSPHSWHSTNSASSSRATTRTRGCLQTCSMLILWGGNLAGWVVLIFRDISGPVRLILASADAMSSAYLRIGHYDDPWGKAVAKSEVVSFQRNQASTVGYLEKLPTKARRTLVSNHLR